MDSPRGDKPEVREQAPAQGDESGWVVLGRISGLFGVKGWVKVYSHTSPRDNILDYPVWHLRLSGRWERFELEQGQVHGKGIVAKLSGCDDRDRAAELMKADIAVGREQLPATEANEYYWGDLEGLQVVTLGGQTLGQVDHLFETGANDVMVLKGERQRLLPFVENVITSVDLAGGVIVVDWDPDF